MVSKPARTQHARRWKSAAARRLIEMAGNPSSVAEAVEVVVSQLVEGVGCPPTDLAAVGARLRITRWRAADLTVSGELHRDQDGFEIVYSSRLSDGRRRFTIAHEMAHALFEMSGANPPRRGHELERICDMLASEILMPRDMFIQHAGLFPSLGKVFELSRLFGTSLAATAIRLCELRSLSAFEVEQGRITWSWGEIRTLNEEIRPTIDEVLRGFWVDRVVFLPDRTWGRDWRIEGAPLGRGGRGLFLAWPA